MGVKRARVKLPVHFDICRKCEKPHDPDVKVKQCICGGRKFRRHVLIAGVFTYGR